MTRRQYSNTATEATLTAGIAAGDLSFTLTSFAGYPAVPFTATISRGLADEEVVLITANSAGTVTATRGYDGTTAKSHSAGATFLLTAIAKDFDEANAHINTTTGVHGATGAVVGTTDVQTLTNKSLTAPTLANASSTGTHALVNGTFSGTVSVAGLTTLAGLTASGAATFTNNISVSGSATLSGAVTVPVSTLAAHPARKDYVDAADTALSGRVTVNENTLTAATASPTVSTLAKRDAAGRMQAVSPSAGADVAIKTYVDAADTALGTRVGVFEADGGWLTLTPAAGFSTGASGHARYRVRGGICYWSVYLAYTGAIGAAVTVTTFPAGARPTAQLAFPSSYSGVSTEMTLTTGGALATIVSTSANGVVAAGSFPVT